MRIRTWKNILKEGIKNTFQNRVMSLASISAMAAALFVLGLVLAAVLNLNNIVESIESKIEITVFIQDEAPDFDIIDMEQQIRIWDGIHQVDFISKEEALQIWREEWGDKSYLLDGYHPENNPLPNSFLVKVEKPEYVEEIVKELESFPYVEKVQYSGDVVEAISRIAATTRLIGLFVVLVLSITAVVIINNTIKITVYSRRKEINIMKYIGATDWYIKWPFIIEGFILGILGALISTGFLAAVYTVILNSGSSLDSGESFLSVFKLLPMERLLYIILTVFFIVGSLVGILGSALSVHKHLKV